MSNAPTAAPTDSFVRNTFISPRTPEDILFVGHDDGTITARLDGYAVIPIEQYRALRPDLDLDRTGR